MLVPFAISVPGSGQPIPEPAGATFHQHVYASSATLCGTSLVVVQPYLIVRKRDIITAYHSARRDRPLLAGMVAGAPPTIVPATSTTSPRSTATVSSTRPSPTNAAVIIDAVGEMFVASVSWRPHHRGRDVAGPRKWMMASVFSSLAGFGADVRVSAIAANQGDMAGISLAKLAVPMLAMMAIIAIYHRSLAVTAIRRSGC